MKRVKISTFPGTRKRGHKKKVGNEDGGSNERSDEENNIFPTEVLH